MLQTTVRHLHRRSPRNLKRLPNRRVPFDDDINDALQDADGLRNFFKPGKYLGYAWVQGGAAVGLYVVGRYFMEPDAGTHTHKVAHLGFDLLRANIVTQALTYGIKASVRRTARPASVARFPRAMPRSPSRPPQSWSGILVIATAGRCL